MIFRANLRMYRRSVAAHRDVPPSLWEEDHPGVKALCAGQVPALIAKFESTGTPVPLQCHPEVVRPNGHAELPG
jgi:hypothetical protein